MIVGAPGRPSFAEAFRFWVKLGFISFGGPAGQIALMHEELVERRRWIGESRFLHALNYCMLLPGPEAQQLAIYIGWLLHRTAGGLVAGAFFVLPSVVILWSLSYAYARLGGVGWVAALFYGLKPAVVAIVAVAVIRIGRRALKNEVMWGIAALAFVAIFALDVPFPLIVLGAGLLGLVGGKLRPGKFTVIGAPGAAGPGADPGAASESAPIERRVHVADHHAALPHTRFSLRHALMVAGVGLVVWWLPVAGLGVWRGWESIFVKEGVFFSQAALVTFGGAYAVLPYVAQRAVEDFGWLTAGQMLDGLGLAETTPGPLIMVVQFVGFMGGWNEPGGLAPVLAGTIGALITTWVTFVPSFLWIFLGAPAIERSRGQVSLAGALSAITAAVVGVILNLAVWFALQVLFPAGGGVDGFALLVAVVVFVGMLRLGWGVVPVVLGGALVGFGYRNLIAP